MRYTADVKFRFLNVQNTPPQEQSGERTWDNIEADSTLEAHDIATNKLVDDEPNLVSIQEFVIKQYEWPNENK
jgi:hypothetical protein